MCGLFLNSNTTFIQCWTMEIVEVLLSPWLDHVKGVAPSLYKCRTNVLCLLGIYYMPTAANLHLQTTMYSPGAAQR